MARSFRLGPVLASLVALLACAPATGSPPSALPSPVSAVTTPSPAPATATPTT
ncbi:MAG: hypothetical protein KGQ88_06700 [Chloroflexi bacterium]|nr:hypothetical protein [Chloroflexota bacterium]